MSKKKSHESQTSQTSQAPHEPQPLMIEYVDVATLNPAPYNPRVIDDAAYQRLKRGIEQFGLTDPIIARREDRLVIGGHQRLRVWTELGHATAPVILLAGLSDAQCAALNVLLNNPQAQGTWDVAQLSSVLSLIDRSDVDLALTGFDLDAAKNLLSYGEGEAIADHRNEWAGMPEYALDDQRAYHHLTVHFEDDAAIADFAQRVGRDVTKATHYLWFPPQAPVVASTKAYVAGAVARDDEIDDGTDDESASERDVLK